MFSDYGEKNSYDIYFGNWACCGFTVSDSKTIIFEKSRHISL